MGIRTKLNPLGGKSSSGSGGGGSDGDAFGFRIDTTNSNPSTAVTYIGKNASYTPASMDFTTGTLNYGSWGDAFFQPRPVMLKYDGTVDYELDHNDFTKKLDGSASDVSNTSYGGNCMIAFPQVWMKFETNGNYQDVYIASEQLDSNYRCYTHINKNGVMLDEIFVMAYEPSNISNKLRSLADQTICISTAGTTMRTNAQANGTSWDFMDLGTVQMIQMLFILMFKTLNSQEAAGAGIVKGNNNTYKTGGATKDKGMFYALTNDATTSGVAVTPIKVFGIENLWGNRYKWINGLMMHVGTGTLYYKLCDYTTDGTTVTGYNPNNTADAITGMKSKVLGTSSKTYYKLGMPSTSDGLMWDWSSSGGSNSTYYCDGMYFTMSTNASYTNNYCPARFGGTYGNGAAAGLFCVFLRYYDPLSYSVSHFGASLSCKPL